MKLYFSLLLAAFASTAHCASFDCAKAISSIETMICQNTELSALDNQLLKAYKTALADSSSPNDIKGEQKDWLYAVRNHCTDIACLKTAYQSRLKQLAAIKPLSGVAGDYERHDENASINVQAVEYEQFHITGNAVWIGNAKTGNVNIGELDGLFELEGNTLHYRSGQDEQACKLTLTFSTNHLTVSDDNGYCGGKNVRFDGEYDKKSAKKR